MNNVECRLCASARRGSFCRERYPLLSLDLQQIGVLGARSARLIQSTPIRSNKYVKMFRDNGSVPISHRIFESPPFVEIVRAVCPSSPLRDVPLPPRGMARCGVGVLSATRQLNVMQTVSVRLIRQSRRCDVTMAPIKHSRRDCATPLSSLAQALRAASNHVNNNFM